MGADLAASSGAAPGFLVWAVRDSQQRAAATGADRQGLDRRRRLERKSVRRRLLGRRGRSIRGTIAAPTMAPRWTCPTAASARTRETRNSTRFGPIRSSTLPSGRFIACASSRTPLAAGRRGTPSAAASSRVRKFTKRSRSSPGHRRSGTRRKPRGRGVPGRRAAKWLPNWLLNLLKDPLVHFLALGLLLFVADAFVADPSSWETDKTIRISEGDVRRLDGGMGAVVAAPSVQR